MSFNVLLRVLWNKHVGNILEIITSTFCFLCFLPGIHLLLSLFTHNSFHLLRVMLCFFFVITFNPLCFQTSWIPQSLHFPSSTSSPPLCWLQFAKFSLAASAPLRFPVQQPTTTLGSHSRLREQTFLNKSKEEKESGTRMDYWAGLVRIDAKQWPRHTKQCLCSFQCCFTDDK